MNTQKQVDTQEYREMHDTRFSNYMINLDGEVWSKPRKNGFGAPQGNKTLTARKDIRSGKLIVSLIGTDTKRYIRKVDDLIKLAFPDA